MVKRLKTINELSPTFFLFSSPAGSLLGQNTMPPETQLEARIRRYWDARAKRFGELRRAEFAGVRRSRWLTEIIPTLGENPKRILDIGTGTGFFAILLAQIGHQVDGIDLSPGMIHEATRQARENRVQCLFSIMDAMTLSFPDDTFDAIVTRNLTWTLPNVELAYREWFRVLKPCGVLLNFDADYGPVNFAELTEGLQKDGVKNAHNDIDMDELRECDAIKALLSVSQTQRPQWDKEALERVGFKPVLVDANLSDRLYPERDETWNPVRMFRIEAHKPHA